MEKNWKTVATIAVGVVVGVLTAGIGTDFYTGLVGSTFWGGVLSAATSGAIAGAFAGGTGAALYGGNISQGILQGAAFGALSGAVFGGMINKVGGSNWNWKVGLERVGLSAVAGGGISEVAGGSFKDGAIFAGAIAGADFAYRAILSTDGNGQNRGASMKTARQGGRPKIGVDLSVDGKPSYLNNPDEVSNVGFISKAGDHSLKNFIGGETGPVMSTLGRFAPGFQGLSLAHDITDEFLTNAVHSSAVNFVAFNFQTMPALYGLNAMGSLINNSPGMIGFYEGNRENE